MAIITPSVCARACHLQSGNPCSDQRTTTSTSAIARRKCISPARITSCRESARKAFRLSPSIRARSASRWHPDRRSQPALRPYVRMIFSANFRLIASRNTSKTTAPRSSGELAAAGELNQDVTQPPFLSSMRSGELGAGVYLMVARPADEQAAASSDDEEGGGVRDAMVHRLRSRPDSRQRLRRRPCFSFARWPARNRSRAYSASRRPQQRRSCRKDERSRRLCPLRRRSRAWHRRPSAGHPRRRRRQR